MVAITTVLDLEQAVVDFLGVVEEAVLSAEAEADGGGKTTV